MLGAVALVAMDRWLPHEHFITGIEGSRERARAAPLATGGLMVGFVVMTMLDTALGTEAAPCLIEASTP